ELVVGAVQVLQGRQGRGIVLNADRHEPSLHCRGESRPTHLASREGTLGNRGYRAINHVFTVKKVAAETGMSPGGGSGSRRIRSRPAGLSHQSHTHTHK